MTKYINWFFDQYKKICYFEFDQKKQEKNRLFPKIYHCNFVILRFINRNIKRQIRAANLDNYSVLDLGCGVKPYQKLFFGAAKYFGVDFAGDKKDLEFDLNEPLDLNEKYDIVVCFDAMEHVKNTGNLISSIRTNLKTGGLLIISCPFFFNVHGSPFDYYRFTKNYYLDFFKDSFELLDIEFSNHFASTPFLHLNILIFYLPIPYFLKYFFYFLNNLI